MRYIDLLWIEDDQEFVEGILDNFKEDEVGLGFGIFPWHYISWRLFEADSHLELGSLPMELICVDYNLPDRVNGDQIIKKIRSFEGNRSVNIIFYSLNKNESELKELLIAEGISLDKIYFAQKDTLVDRILSLVN